MLRTRHTDVNVLRTYDKRAIRMRYAGVLYGRAMRTCNSDVLTLCDQRAPGYVITTGCAADVPRMAP